jgi:mRNA interferase RelE/StbE
MVYKIAYSKKADKQLADLPKIVQVQIFFKVNELADGAEYLDIKKLHQPEEAGYRLRVGDYRVLYDKYDDILFINIIKIKHRKDAYK